MKRIIAGLMVLMVCLTGWAQLNVSSSISGSGLTNVSASSLTNVPQTLRLVDNVTYPTEANAVQAGWISAGSPAWAFASAPAPLTSPCLRTATASTVATTPLFDTGGTMWFFCLWQPQTLTSEADVWDLRDSTNTAIGVTITVRTTGTLRITSGGNSDFPGVISAAQPYYVMIQYTKASSPVANDAVIKFWASTTGVFTDDAHPQAVRSNGSASANCACIRLRGATSTGQVFDKLRVSTVRFGDNPL